MATQTAMTSRDGAKYKDLVHMVYKQTKENGKGVKNKLIGIVDPICQTDDKYNPPSRRTYTLTEGYNERMSEKKEKIHRRPIPQKDNINFSSNAPAVSEYKYHIKTRPEKNATSDKTYENDKHIRTYPKNDEIKGIFAPFIHGGKKQVEPIIKVNRKKYIPQKNTTDILMMHPDPDYYSNYYSNTDRGHNRVKSETTYDRIFTLGNESDFKENKNKYLYKPNRYSKVNGDSVGDLFVSKTNEKAKEYNVTGKPNQSDFGTLSKQAKIYLTEKYSYDNNASQF